MSAWRSQFSFYDHGLLVGHSNTLQVQREAFAMTVINLFFELFTSPVKVSEMFEIDLFCYRTRGQMELARHLMDLEEEQLEILLIPN